MIASEDVRRVTFDRTMRGYRCEDVDDYLKQVAESMDAMAAEHDEMQKKLVVLAQRIDQYRADEDTLRTTMLNAQRLGENVIKEAKQKAAEILRAANIKAEDREQHARDEVELAQQELISLHHEADSFKKSLMEMYRKHIELLAKLPSVPEEVEPAPAAPEPEPTPEPEPEPIQEPAPEPAPAPMPAPEPAPEEYVQQQFGEPESAAFYQPGLDEPESEAPVDTVEFAIAGKPAVETPDDAPGTAYAEGTRFVPGAGLYEEPEPKPKKKSAKLPQGLESFSGVDFDA